MKGDSSLTLMYKNNPSRHHRHHHPFAHFSLILFFPIARPTTIFGEDPFVYIKKCMCRFLVYNALQLYGKLPYFLPRFFCLYIRPLYFFPSPTFKYFFRFSSIHACILCCVASSSSYLVPRKCLQEHNMKGWEKTRWKKKQEKYIKREKGKNSKSFFLSPYFLVIFGLDSTTASFSLFFFFHSYYFPSTLDVHYWMCCMGITFCCEGESVKHNRRDEEGKKNMCIPWKSSIHPNLNDSGSIRIIHFLGQVCAPI